MKKSELIFTASLVPLDFLMLIISALTAYFLRFEALVELRPVIFEIPFKEYLKYSFPIAFLFLIIFALTGLYTIRKRRFLEEIAKIFIACSAGILLIIVFIFMRRELFTSRFIIIACWILSIFFVSLGRILIRFLKYVSYKRGVGVHRIVLVGENEVSRKIEELVEKNPGLGYKIIKKIKNVEEIKNLEGVDEVIQTETGLEKEKVQELIDYCREKHIVFKYIPESFDGLLTNIRMENFGDIPIIEVKKTPLDGWGRIIKRSFDFIFSLLGLIALSPLFLLIGLLIKLDSRGPVFVILERVGEKGKEFKLWKFRSMIEGAEKMKKDLLKFSERKPPLFKIRNDPRITRVGKFLRKYSLDELPQLINVLKGEMSLVGPRPHEPSEVALYQKHQKKLFTLKPGITGLAQISGRDKLDFEEEARIDSYYIENWSLVLDLIILLKTPFIVLTKPGC